MLNTGSCAGAAIITGGASEIGLATTTRFLAVGWRVAAFDRDQVAIATLHKTFGEQVRIASSTSPTKRLWKPPSKTWPHIR